MASDIVIGSTIARKVGSTWFSNKKMYAFRFIVNAMDVAFPAIALIFLVRTFGSLRGWTLSEAEVLTGLSGASIGLGMLFGGAFDSFLFDGIYRSGEFEAALLRPLNPMIFLASSNLRSYRLGRIAAGVVIAVGFGVNTRHGLEILAVIPFALVFGGLVMCSLYLIDASALLEFGQSNSFTRNLPFATADLGYYPNNLYPSVGRFVAQFVLGIGAAVYLPVSYVLGKGHNFGLWSFAPAPIITLMIMFVSHLCWKRGIRTFQIRGGV